VTGGPLKPSVGLSGAFQALDRACPLPFSSCPLTFNLLVRDGPHKPSLWLVWGFPSGEYNFEATHSHSRAPGRNCNYPTHKPKEGLSGPPRRMFLLWEFCCKVRKRDETGGPHKPSFGLCGAFQAANTTLKQRIRTYERQGNCNCPTQAKRRLGWATPENVSIGLTVAVPALDKAFLRPAPALWPSTRIQSLLVRGTRLRTGESCSIPVFRAFA